jgi:hypothetical protein
MTARTNGAEFKAYYNDKKAWPDGWYHEDATITVNGADIDGADYDGGQDDLDVVDDDAILTIAGGGVYKDDGHPLQISMETHFTRWRKSQKTERVVVEVDKARKTEFLEAIKRSGARVVK